MELLAIIVMFVAGGAVALFVMIAVALGRREAERSGGGGGAATASQERDRIASSLLVQILIAGGASSDAAMREVRRGAGIASPVTPGIDIGNWAESYARIADAAQRAWLLETAVQLVASRGVLVPLRQYVALLDLSFALGFRTDALAKLREQYGFDYVDHAKDARPAEADRGGGRMPLFQREERDERELLRVLEIEGPVTRQVIISAYRRLVAQHHPDRFHGATDTAQHDAATRFIEITRAYEALLAMHRE